MKNDISKVTRIIYKLKKFQEAANKIESFSTADLEASYPDEIIEELYNEISKTYGYSIYSIKAKDVEQFISTQLHQTSDSINPLNRAIKYKILQLAKLEPSKVKSGIQTPGNHHFHANLFNQFRDQDTEAIDNEQFAQFYNSHKKYLDDYIKRQFAELSPNIIDGIESAFESRSKKAIIKSFLQQVYCVKLLNGLEEKKKLIVANQFQDGYQTLFANFLNNLLDEGIIPEDFKWNKLESKWNKLERTGNQYHEMSIFFGTIKKDRLRIEQESCFLTVFPYLGVAVRPKKASVLFWYNLHKSGTGDLLTKHAACPVLVGSKWIANKWLHELDQHFRRPCGLNIND